MIKDFLCHFDAIDHHDAKDLLKTERKRKADHEMKSVGHWNNSLVRATAQVREFKQRRYEFSEPLKGPAAQAKLERRVDVEAKKAIGGLSRAHTSTHKVPELVSVGRLM